MPSSWRLSSSLPFSLREGDRDASEIPDLPRLTIQQMSLRLCSFLLFLRSFSVHVSGAIST